MLNFGEMKKLCSEKKELAMKIEKVGSREVAIFSYNVVMSSTFDSELAKEFRGSVFDVETGKCICRPFKKFFNINECEESKEERIDWSKVLYFPKYDGSIVMPVLFEDKTIHWKSNSTFLSDHAKKAKEIFSTLDLTYQYQLWDMLNEGLTPIFELISNDPKFRIVVEYDSEKLMYLGSRYIDSGDYVPSSSIKIDKEISHHSEIDDEEGIEGYVIWDGEKLYKKKTKWYLERHRAVWGITPRAVIEATLNGSIDDVIGIVAGLNMDQKLQEIQEIRDRTVKTYLNEKEYCVKSYLEILDDLLLDEPKATQKDFALKVQASSLDPSMHHFMYLLHGGKNIEDPLKKRVQNMVEQLYL